MSIYLYGDTLFSSIMSGQQFPSESSLLFEYGVIIGYNLLIVFVVMIQLNNYHQLMHYKPVLGKLFLLTYHLIAIGFSIGAFINYNFQKSVILAMSFLLITAVFEMIRDKIVQIMQGNVVHPKKIL